jgi:hypothetical protein
MFDLIDDLDMDDDMYDNDVDREAAVDYDYEEAQLKGRLYDDDDYEEEEEYVREGKSFPPKPSDWSEIPANTIPIVTFDMAKSHFWDHEKTEIDCFGIE